MMRNSLRVHKKSENHLYWNQLLAHMARILLTAYSQSEFPEQQEKSTRRRESGNQRPKRRKDKLIRLDDLIPKKDVTGGHQLLFGVTDTTQSKNNPTKDK
jgi:hypothetical protein